MAQHRLIENKTYNERLFSPGFRGFFHTARFKWLYNSFNKLGIQSGSFLELGCNDGRSIKYIPVKPTLYYGYDADWEGGLDEAISNYKHDPQIHFFKSDTPQSFNTEHLVFDYTLSMETLEHLPVRYLEEYLKKLAFCTGKYGFYSFPNERGVLFFLKYYFKKFFLKQHEPYTTKEVWHALLGNLDKVERKDTAHKGFDYKKLIKQLEHYFEIVEVKGIPFPLLPLSANFTIGVIVKKK